MFRFLVSVAVFALVPVSNAMALTFGSSGSLVQAPSSPSFVRPSGVSPQGYLEAPFYEPGGLRVRGWAVDTDVAPAMKVSVRITVDGVAMGEIQASSANEDVVKSFPSFGYYHGYDLVIANAKPQVAIRTVCVRYVNLGAYAFDRTECKEANQSPFGRFETTPTGRGFIVSGWAIDPDEPLQRNVAQADVQVEIVVDGVMVRRVEAWRHVVDVKEAYVADLQAHPDYGMFHGFDPEIDAKTGPHVVCVDAVNLKWGATRRLGCVSTQSSRRPSCWTQWEGKRVGELTYGGFSRGTVDVAIRDDGYYRRDWSEHNYEGLRIEGLMFFAQDGAAAGVARDQVLVRLVNRVESGSAKRIEAFNTCTGFSSQVQDDSHYEEYEVAQDGFPEGGRTAEAIAQRSEAHAQWHMTLPVPTMLVSSRDTDSLYFTKPVGLFGAWERAVYIEPDQFWDAFGGRILTVVWTIDAPPY